MFSFSVSVSSSSSSSHDSATGAFGAALVEVLGFDDEEDFGLEDSARLLRDAKRSSVSL
jgi:hypothetical protein